MIEKNKTNSAEAASEAMKEIVRLCNVCGEIRKEPGGTESPVIKNSNGKEETNTKT